MGTFDMVLRIETTLSPPTSQLDARARPPPPLSSSLVFDLQLLHVGLAKAAIHILSNALHLLAELFEGWRCSGQTNPQNAFVCLQRDTALKKTKWSKKMVPITYVD